MLFYYLLDIDRNGYIEKKEMKKIMDVRYSIYLI